MNKNKLFLIFTVLLVVVTSIYIYYLFASKIELEKVSEGVADQIFYKNNQIIYFKNEGNKITIIKREKNGTENIIKILEGVFVGATVSPDGNKFAVLTEQYSNVEEPTAEFFVISDGRQVYNNKVDPPHDFYFTSDQALITFSPNPEDWTEPGTFYTIDTLNGKKEKIKEYSTSGVRFLSSNNNEVDFFDIDHEDPKEGAPKKIVKTLNITAKNINDSYEIEGLTSGHQSDNKLLYTKIIDGRYSVYAYDKKNNKETLISDNNSDRKFSFYKDRPYGFYPENYTLDESSEGTQSEEGAILRDSFRKTSKSKDLLKNQSLISCFNPIIVSDKETYFTCGSILYKTTGLIY